MTQHLLVVDDDNAFRDRLARALTARGFSVAPVATAAQALQSMERAKFSGAIIDMHLPDSQGLALLDQLVKRDPLLSVVVLTGFGSIAIALEAVRHGARDFLTKPVSPDQILGAMRGERITQETGAAPVAKVLSLGRVEWEHIQRVLTECEGNISKTARLLGIDRRSLQRKLGKYPPPE